MSLSSVEAQLASPQLPPWPVKSILRWCSTQSSIGIQRRLAYTWFPATRAKVRCTSAASSGRASQDTRPSNSKMSKSRRSRRRPIPTSYLPILLTRTGTSASFCLRLARQISSPGSKAISLSGASASSIVFSARAMRIKGPGLPACPLWLLPQLGCWLALLSALPKVSKNTIDRHIPLLITLISCYKNFPRYRQIN